ncbi:vWA domain-containing protein [Ectobacillus ponti]|uniref:VWA domain-containing protein n=1 Tax=Ectobacillus ponti TaxID=2961894 RepID=A0AA41X744_9BACI|nr:vWA domain-containing protein [Ectobacillus ponti]MCP8969952.1 VWA domain-containing protein [Ectobacillus ponti]
MNHKLTELIFLLDRSGSMAGLESDTIGGFNSLVARQCRSGETRLTAVLFDDEYEVLWSGADAKGVQLTDREYYVRGCTAMLDAIGKTILDAGRRLSQTPEAARPGKVMFVITTDGLENVSREFTHEKVSQMIQHQQEKYGWEFIFLGANMDAVREAESIGIQAEDAYAWEASEKGVAEMYGMLEEELSVRRKK